MEIVQPAIGQIFWGGLVFLTLLFLFAKFAWKPIVNAVAEREKSIKEALEMADNTKREMQQLAAQNEAALRDAKIEREKMLRDASDSAKQLITEARNEGKVQRDKIVAEAQRTIASEKAAALSELKSTVASLSLEIAEKIIRGELASAEKQKALAEKMAEDISLN